MTEFFPGQTGASAQLGCARRLSPPTWDAFSGVAGCIIYIHIYNLLYLYIFIVMRAEMPEFYATENGCCHKNI